MELLTNVHWRTRTAFVSLRVMGIASALVLALAASVPAFAATIHISTDPFTQATCAGSNTTESAHPARVCGAICAGADGVARHRPTTDSPLW